MSSNTSSPLIDRFDSRAVRHVGLMADDEDEKHKEMRKLLLEIHRNPALTMKEKANLQQKLLSTSYSNRDKPKCRSSKTSSQATAGFPLPPAFSHACECVCSCPENITGQRTTLSCSGGCLASSCPAKLSSDTDCTRQLSSSPPSMAIARSASVLSPSYSNEEKHIFGCEHYPRGCMILAACCRQFFPCRWCHDEAVSGHKINRYNTEMMWCMYCTTVQSIAQSCCNPLCPSQMANGGPGNLARYYCDVCKFHDDTPDKQIYHCPDCAICRIGEGLGEKLFHCHKCCIDLPISFKVCPLLFFDGRSFSEKLSFVLFHFHLLLFTRQNNHVCIDKKDSQCVICLEDILTSRLAAVLLKCGHSMHSSCYQDYARKYSSCACVENESQCPIYDLPPHFLSTILLLPL